MRAAIFVAVLLAVGHLAAAQDTCPFKDTDLSAVKWSVAKTACAAPEATFCSACICGLKNTILDGLTAKGIKVAPADQTNLINNCLGALATPLSDPKVGNLADEVGKLVACEDPAAIAAKCPAAPAATTKPAAKAAATAGTSPVPAVEAVALPSPAVSAVPAASPAATVAAASPPPKSAAGAVVASMGAVAAVALLQAMLY